MRTVLAFLLLFAVFPLSSGQATTAMVLDLEAHIAQSSAVLVARVGDSHQEVDAKLGRPFTYTELQVQETLKGSVGAQLTIRQLGGVLDGQQQMVLGDGQLPVGKRVLVFLHQDPDGQWYLTALGQSVYHIDGDGDAARVTRDLTGLSLMKHSPTGKLEPVHPDQAESTLGQLKQAILAEVR